MNRLSILSLATGMSAALVLAGCGTTTVRMSVLRPAQVNAQPYGATMSIGEFGAANYAWAQPATLIAQDLRQRVVGAEGGTVRFLEAGGGMVIHGQLLDHTYHEEVTRRSETCTRTENKRSVNYPCTRYTRTGKAHIQVIFNVSTAAGVAVAATTFEDDDETSTTATDEQPAAIDGQGMLRAIRETLTAKFAKVILPWREDVDAVFADCEDPAEATCEAGVRFVVAGDYPRAVDSFERAAGMLDPAAGVDADDKAKPHWNLGLALEYSGRYPEAIASISRAIQLDPSESDYQEELENVRRMQADTERLRQQGIGQAQAQDVQAGGTP